MRDQATQLRNLVLRSAGAAAAKAGPAPRLVVLAGGKGGVGVTTLTVNLGVAWSELGARVILVDADLYRADMAALCHLPERESVADVLAARRDIHEVLVRGPAGVQVVPGVWAPGQVTDCTEKAQQRLVSQFRLLGRHADVVLLDVGSGGGSMLPRFAEAADDVLLITTPDPVSMMDAYATIKTWIGPAQQTKVRILVNQCDSHTLANEVFDRIARSCHRFLGMAPGLLGWVPQDENAAEAARQALPLVVASPQSAAAVALAQIAESLQNQTWPPASASASAA